MKKKWYKSKTIWFNSIAATLVVLEQALPVLQTITPIHPTALVVIPLVNLWLRAITKEGVGK